MVSFIRNLPIEGMNYCDFDARSGSMTKYTVQISVYVQSVSLCKFPKL